ncbi:hypothetical protein COK78_22485 [Bacillus thuringiensis]|nr:hypothetical protein COK78_22485 [Bacillus thuringiensis]
MHVFMKKIEACQRLGRTESATFGYCIKFTKSQCFLDEKKLKIFFCFYKNLYFCVTFCTFNYKLKTRFS